MKKGYQCNMILKQHTCTMSSFCEAHLGVWSLPIIRMKAPVAFLISETIVPPFPNKQPTWFEGTTRRAETGDPLLDLKSSPFTAAASTDLLNTRTTAFWAGECLDSGFYKSKSETRTIINSFTTYQHKEIQWKLTVAANLHRSNSN